MKRVMAGLIVMAVLFVGAITVDALQARQQRHSACIGRRDLYDGQFVLARFLGHELQASEERINEGLARLRAELGSRPNC